MMAEARSEKAKPRRSPFAVDAHLVRPRKQPSAQPTGLRGAQQVRAIHRTPPPHAYARLLYVSLRVVSSYSWRATSTTRG
jgi:hypothetical protein